MFNHLIFLRSALGAMLQDRCLDEGEMDITEMVDDGTARNPRARPWSPQTLLNRNFSREAGQPVDLGFQNVSDFEEET